MLGGLRARVRGFPGPNVQRNQPPQELRLTDPAALLVNNNKRVARAREKIVRLESEAR
jgi:hypothetical protein